ncbi:MAG TPA: hypothetical protein VGM84_19970 [Steroidobacteraceae bacterium]|jgi:hypothetical protein
MNKLKQDAGIAAAQFAPFRALFETLVTLLQHQTGHILLLRTAQIQATQQLMVGMREQLLAPGQDELPCDPDIRALEERMELLLREARSQMAEMQKSSPSRFAGNNRVS